MIKSVYLKCAFLASFHLTKSTILKKPFFTKKGYKRMNLSNNKRVLVVFSPKKAKINIFDFLKKVSFFCGLNFK
jgi:hypothetical protein